MLCADHLVLVTTPEIAALTDAYAVVKSLHKLNADTTFSVVLNRVLRSGDGEMAFDKLAEVAKRHTGVELTFLGEIPDDPAVTQRRLGQEPLVVSEPEGPTAQAVEIVAEQLEKVAGPLGPREVAQEKSLEQRFRQHRLFL